MNSIFSYLISIGLGLLICLSFSTKCKSNDECLGEQICLGGSCL
uniref:WAP domain-containing protein n=1 Tax=Tetranychus urticae TaxID=32264 RepID=T1KKV3_TETUR